MIVDIVPFAIKTYIQTLFHNIINIEKLYCKTNQIQLNFILNSNPPRFEAKFLFLKNY